MTPRCEINASFLANFYRKLFDRAIRCYIFRARRGVSAPKAVRPQDHADMPASACQQPRTNLPLQGCVVILNKRSKSIRPDETRQYAGRSFDNVVPFPEAKPALDALDRLVMFLAKRAAAKDHLASQGDDQSCEQ